MSIAHSRKPVLIANRGEIAIRIARTCRALGFPVVGIYSDADRSAEHLRHCDFAAFVGGAAPQESYLNIAKVIEAAKQSGALYIHPGYGFLSERPQFVDSCEANQLIFVGPSAKSMRLMGDKIQARMVMDQLGVPRVPGSQGAVPDDKEALRIAREIGFPILLKAAAGGGGKGMRRVDSEAELASAFSSAARESLSAFGDGSLYVEKLILEPHHVEIQVFGDGQGKAIHLGERECSIQRRHQKVWEESPAPILDRFEGTREAMFACAVKIAEHVSYSGAGTLEFIVDGQGKFYFLEMNTRLQVEHPVTEWVCGIDLVAWQLLLAAGEFQLPKSPDRRGHAVEVRLYAEDPEHFLPAPGRIDLVQFPSGPFVRVDSAFSESGEVSVHYDPMIAKISTWGQTREEAIGKLRVALDETRVLPPKKEWDLTVGSLKTNLVFLKRLTRHPVVLSGDTSTDLISKNSDLTQPCFDVRAQELSVKTKEKSGMSVVSEDLSLEAALAVSISRALFDQETSQKRADQESTWHKIAREEGLR